MFKGYQIGASIFLTAIAIVSIVACGKGAASTSSGPLTSTSTCANWTADVSANDTTDMDNFVSGAASDAQVPNATIISFISGHCGVSNPNDNLTAIRSAAALSASAPTIPTN